MQRLHISIDLRRYPIIPVPRTAAFNGLKAVRVAVFTDTHGDTRDERIFLCDIKEGDLSALTDFVAAYLSGDLAKLVLYDVSAARFLL